MQTSPKSSTKFLTRRALPGLVLALVAVWQVPASAACAYYSGRATAVRASANILKSSTRVVVADTGEIDPQGATRDATVVSFTNPPPTDVRSDTFRAIAGGAEWVSASNAATEKLIINTPKVKVTADLIESNATATCHPDSMTVSTAATAQLYNLRVNGFLISPNSPPNKKTTIGNMTIITNEQSRPDVNTITVNALHIIIPTILGVAGTDIVVSRSEAGILSCPCQ